MSYTAASGCLAFGLAALVLQTCTTLSNEDMLSKTVVLITLCMILSASYVRSLLFRGLNHY